ncbi:MAG TPA: hypothetical protein VF175_09565, partial [Lacipirellula sp.]
EPEHPRIRRGGKGLERAIQEGTSDIVFSWHQAPLLEDSPVFERHSRVFERQRIMRFSPTASYNSQAIEEQPAGG